MCNKKKKNGTDSDSRTDITELKKKEQALTQAKQQANEADQAKSIFLHNMSHDLRTPVTGMLGMAESLVTEIPSVSGKKSLGYLTQATKTLLDLLNAVIEFARLSQGTLPIDDIPFDVRQLLMNIQNLVYPAVQQKKLTLLLDCDEAMPLYLRGDPTRIHRIVLNLVSNAIKFTSQGTIEISACCHQQDSQQVLLEITVADTGVGIPTDKQSFIFSRFNRLQPAYHGIYGGCGLGLTLVKQCVAELGGEIELTSRAGQGSVFTVRLLVKKSLRQESAGYRDDADLYHYNKVAKMLLDQETYYSRAYPLHPESPHRYRVLLVEDNNIAQLAAKQQLLAWHCEVETVDDGEQAIALATQKTYDVIVMDVGLPDRDGIQVTNIIRHRNDSRNQNTVIVALTAHAVDDKKHACLAAGMHAVFTKPLNEAAWQQIKTMIERIQGNLN